MVVAVAVAIVLAVRFVVLVVVRDEIVEIETVMAVTKLTLARPASALVEEIAGSRTRLAKSAIDPSSPFQKVAHAVLNLSFHSAHPGGN